MARAEAQVETRHREVPAQPPDHGLRVEVPRLREGLRREAPGRFEVATSDQPFPTGVPASLSYLLG